jgi:hypothetical protein
MCKFTKLTFFNNPVSFLQRANADEKPQVTATVRSFRAPSPPSTSCC